MFNSIQLYTETMDRHFRWHIDERQAEPDMRASEALVAQIPNWFPLPVKLTPKLEGMLFMGLGRKTPHAFPQKRIPSAMSEKLMEIYLDDTRACNASWLTRKELVIKATELLVSPDKTALECRPTLIDLINQLPEYSGDPRHQRIVFWLRN